MESSDVDPINILLVDDRVENLESLAAILQRSDYNLILARSGFEALDRVLRNDVALILMDVAMPNMDGFETASLIRSRAATRHVPIIFVTASVYDMDHVFRGYTVGAVDYLRKPVDAHEVRSKVAVFVELYRQRLQIERQSKLLREAEAREQSELRSIMERALRESELLYEHTFESAPVGIAHAGRDGVMTRMNQRLREMLDTQGDNVTLWQLVDDEDAVRAGVDKLELWTDGEAIDVVDLGEQLRTSASGERTYLAVRLAALRDGAGIIARIVVVALDVTERRLVDDERLRLVDELRQAVQARDDFLSVAAHELKTPLTPLRLQTASLVRDSGRDASIDRAAFLKRVTVIDRSAERLETLVDRLLDASRLSEGRLTLDVDDVDLGDVVKEVVARHEVEAVRSGSTVSVDVAGAPVRGRWDRLRIEQVIANILGNAIKYGEGRPVELHVSKRDDRAVLDVVDHGLGIPREMQPRIFERFARFVPLRNYSGFGLGLWVVKEIVLAHGGEVHVDSEPGRGSRFTVKLPALQQTTDQRAERDADGTTTEATP